MVNRLWTIYNLSILGRDVTKESELDNIPSSCLIRQLADKACLPDALDLSFGRQARKEKAKDLQVRIMRNANAQCLYLRGGWDEASTRM